MTCTKTLFALAVGLLLLATPAWADFRTERRLALEPGGTFTLNADIGTVTLTGDSTSGALVTVTSRRDDFNELFDMRFDETSGGVTVTIQRRSGSWLKGFWGDWSGYDTQIVVHVPSKTSANVRTAGGSIDATRLSGRLTVRTSGGSLRAEEIDGAVEGTTSGGSIRMRDVSGDTIARTSGGGIDISGVRGSLEATTSGGGIDIDTVSGDLRASTSGGGVEVRGAGGRVEAHTSGGPVTVRFAAGNKSGGELTTSGGGVRTEVDPAVALTIDASSSGGNVQADLPVTVQGTTRNSLRGDINGGGALLRLRSSGGGVRISAMRATK
jgi:putative adhesin